jgi:aryl-alcohol dehydrogenase-like predicted oxidoreductase
MTPARSAAKAGTFEFDGRTICRIGLGTMRLIGSGVWEPAANYAEAIRTLRRAEDYGIDLIHTADSYGSNYAGFIPWFQLTLGDPTRPGLVLDVIAKRHDASPSHIALAWLLQRSPIILPIPGTSQVSDLNANTRAVDILLDEDRLQEPSLGGKTNYRPAG